MTNLVTSEIHDTFFEDIASQRWPVFFASAHWVSGRRRGTQVVDTPREQRTMSSNLHKVMQPQGPMPRWRRVAALRSVTTKCLPQGWVLTSCSLPPEVSAHLRRASTATRMRVHPVAPSLGCYMTRTDGEEGGYAVEIPVRVEGCAELPEAVMGTTGWWIPYGANNVMRLRESYNGGAELDGLMYMPEPAGAGESRL